jgi:predicted transglutaminase-like cysteine proteinase
MLIRKNARRLARALSLASALTAGRLPCTVAAAQTPEAGAIVAPPEVESAALADLRPTLDLLAGTDEPFDLPGLGRPGAVDGKWRRAARGIAQDRAMLARCRSAPDNCPAGALQALAIIAAAQGREGRARLAEVNRAVNLAIRYRSDTARHGTADAWTTPVAALAAGEGDCEDYAIAKYMALHEIGVAAGDLRLVLVRDTRLGQDHAVLAARLDGRWLLLDNRRFSLVEDRDAHAYHPVAALGPETRRFSLADEDVGRGSAPWPPPERGDDDAL